MSNKLDVSDAMLAVGLLCVLVGLYAMWGWPVVVLVLGIVLVACGYRLATVKAGGGEGK